MEGAECAGGFYRGERDALIAYARYHSAFTAEDLEQLRDAATLPGEVGRVAREALRGPPLPWDCAHLWSWFLELAGARSEGMSGANPLTHRDILAWRALRGMTPSEMDVTLLLLLDRECRTKSKTPSPTAPHE